MGAKQLAAALLPVTASKMKEGKMKQSRMPLMSVQEVLKWALLAACLVAVTAAISTAVVLADIHILIPYSQPSSGGDQQVAVSSVPLLPAATELIPAQVPLAYRSPGRRLLLPLHHARSRWSLAMVSAAIFHYMAARTTAIFIAARPGDVVYAVLAGGGAVVYLLVDLLAFLSLLIGGAADQ